MKEEALKLADELLHSEVMVLELEASRMICRLVEELDKQEYRRTHEGFSTIIDKCSPQIKPLSDEEVEELREYHGINDWLYETSVIDFARAIEERHGIK